MSLRSIILFCLLALLPGFAGRCQAQFELPDAQGTPCGDATVPQCWIGECPEGQICQTNEANSCSCVAISQQAVCAVDDDCSWSSDCVSGACVSRSERCRDDEFPRYNERGWLECQPGCSSEISCRHGSYCNPNPGLQTPKCVPGCLENSQCQLGNICDTTTNRCMTGCATDDSCELGQICNDLGLTTPDILGGGTARFKACMPGCRSCESSLEFYCGAGESTGLCERLFPAAPEDLVSAYRGCPGGQRCQNGQCVIGECSSQADCPENHSCLSEREQSRFGLSQECVAGSRCISKDDIDGVGCVVLPHENPIQVQVLSCPFGFYCDGDNHCRTGCSSFEHCLLGALKCVNPGTSLRCEDSSCVPGDPFNLEDTQTQIADEELQVTNESSTFELAVEASAAPISHSAAEPVEQIAPTPNPIFPAEPEERIVPEAETKELELFAMPVDSPTSDSPSDGTPQIASEPNAGAESADSPAPDPAAVAEPEQPILPEPEADESEAPEETDVASSASSNASDDEISKQWLNEVLATESESTVQCLDEEDPSSCLGDDEDIPANPNLRADASDDTVINALPVIRLYASTARCARLNGNVVPQLLQLLTRNDETIKIGTVSILGIMGQALTPAHRTTAWTTLTALRQGTTNAALIQEINTALERIPANNSME